MTNKITYVDKRLEMYLKIMNRKQAFALVVCNYLAWRKQRYKDIDGVARSTVIDLMMTNHNYTNEESISFLNFIVENDIIKQDEKERLFPIYTLEGKDQ